MAWPASAYTDQPVPAPYEVAPDIKTYPRNGFGFTLAKQTPCGVGTSGVEEVWESRNYTLTHLVFTEVRNCVTFRAGILNHFEVRISQSRLEIFGTDAGSTALKELGFVANANLPLTRGLIWIEDGHYAANKFGTQQIHTFVWDNVAFDGPALPGDLHLDVNDAHVPVSSTRSLNLGWGFDAGASLSFPIPGADAASLARASGALLTFNAQLNGTPAITYRLGGRAAHTVPWPLAADQGANWATFAFPVPLEDLMPGTNTVRMSFGSSGVIANVDLILVGARDTGGSPTPTGAPMPPSATPTCVATPYGCLAPGTYSLRQVLKNAAGKTIYDKEATYVVH
jgi:hypothetical protein